MNDTARAGAVRSAVAGDGRHFGGGKSRLDIGEPRIHEGREVIGIARDVEVGVHWTWVEVTTRHSWILVARGLGVRHREFCPDVCAVCILVRTFIRAEMRLQPQVRCAGRVLDGARR